MSTVASNWTSSTDHPGYRLKTIKRGACTIQILRPELDEAEGQKREKHAQATLERTLSDYYIRKDKKR